MRLIKFKKISLVFVFSKTIDLDEKHRYSFSFEINKSNF